LPDQQEREKECASGDPCPFANERQKETKGVLGKGGLFGNDFGAFWGPKADRKCEIMWETE
jgi:hypothetical protein